MLVSVMFSAIVFLLPTWNVADPHSVLQRFFYFWKQEKRVVESKFVPWPPIEGRIAKSSTSVSCEAAVDLKGFGHRWTFLQVLPHTHIVKILVWMYVWVPVHVLCAFCSVWISEVHSVKHEVLLFYGQSGWHIHGISSVMAHKVCPCHMISHVPPLQTADRAQRFSQLNNLLPIKGTSPYKTTLFHSSVV